MVDEGKKELIKELLRELHTCEDPEVVKDRIKQVLREVTAAEISQAEQELIEEGLPKERLHRLCDIHMEVFKESVEVEREIAPEGHPIHTLMAEHRLLLGFATELREVGRSLTAATDEGAAGELTDRLVHLIDLLKDSENHYLREENVLFPYLERHGVTQPPAIMWMEHDNIRALKKGLYELVDARGEGFADRLVDAATGLAEMLSQHFYKENNILFPTAMDVIEEAEWPEILAGFDDVGYCCFTPGGAPREAEAPAAAEERAAAPEGMVPLEPGPLSVDELESILNGLPVDISFVDAQDKVRYFNETPERIFVRTKAVIGRTVQGCHPDKSMHMVQRILDDFRAGTRDSAEFWINLGGMLVHIRYFAVRNKEGRYLGCLEVTQDITDLQKLTGEKRLLD